MDLGKGSGGTEVLLALDLRLGVCGVLPTWLCFPPPPRCCPVQSTIPKCSRCWSFGVSRTSPHPPVSCSPFQHGGGCMSIPVSDLLEISHGGGHLKHEKC